MRRRLVITCVAAFFLSGWKSGTAATAVRCDSCNAAAAQASAIDASDVVFPGDQETVFVFDYAGLRLTRWQIKFEAEVGVMALPGVVTSSQSAAFQSFASTMNGLAGSEHILEASSDDYATIGQIAGCIGCANNWVTENIHSLSQQLPLMDVLIAEIGNLAAQIPVGGGAITATAENELRYKLLLTSDQSGGPHQPYCMAELTSTGLVANANACFDSDLNPIPVKAEDVGFGYWLTVDNNLNHFVQRITLFGIPFTGSGTVSVGGMQVTCSVKGCADSN